jgi:hypothetical protein
VRPLLPRDEIQARLNLIFPRKAFDTVLSNPLASSAVATMLYVDAVQPEPGQPLSADAAWVRPSMCLWMNDGVYAHANPAEREAWRTAALSGQARERLARLSEQWRVTDGARYRDNTRETLRDETFPQWLDHGAMRARTDLPTTSSRPRWALTEQFADLFDPSLQGEALVVAVDSWRATHMDPGDRLRISTHRERDRQVHQVTVTLPDNTVRQLEPGAASLILKGVVEHWAPARLGDPVVLTISEPGDKVYVADEARLRALGLAIDPSSLLPDAVIVDIATKPPTFWIIEAVASDGPVDESRRTLLRQWAQDQRIDPDACEFLSAFNGRNDAAARRRLKDLAVGTFAWYADEPTRELAWYELSDVD